MATKTNAVRLLQQAGIPCHEAFYDYDENDLSGNHAAQAIGKPADEVFKTLVARGERTGINVFCIPVCFELNLKKAAKAVGEKSIAMIKAKELLPLTGYVHGGCSPIGMKKFFRTTIHASAKDCPTFYVSAGKIGYQIQLAPADLARVIRFDYADLIVE